MVEDLTLDPDEVESELEEQEQHLQNLLMAATAANDDIQELKQELSRLKEDISDDEQNAISPESANG